MTDSDEKQRGLDATMENEASRDLSPMVQISIKEYVTVWSFVKQRRKTRYISIFELVHQSRVLNTEIKLEPKIVTLAIILNKKHRTILFLDFLYGPHIRLPTPT